MILILGLVLFLGIHIVPMLTGVRNNIVASVGEKPYKLVFSVISALGLVLIVIGYSRAPATPRLFGPFPGAVALAPIFIAISFVLLAAANMKTHIRRAVRHPMLIGLGIWAAVHLLANGSAKGTLLFGAFLAYAAIDIVSATATARHAVKQFTPAAKQDAIAIVAGVLLALLVMVFHHQLFGASVVAWGL